MPENIRTSDHTWMILNQMPNFQQFFRGYLEILKSKLILTTVYGHERSYTYYTCGQDHDRRNPAWKPFQHLMRYCRELRYDFDEARDLIEDRIGWKLKCECELLRN